MHLLVFMLVYKLILTGFACRGNRFCYSSFIFANYNFTLRVWRILSQGLKTFAGAYRRDLHNRQFRKAKTFRILENSLNLYIFPNFWQVFWAFFRQKPPQCLARQPRRFSCGDSLQAFLSTPSWRRRSIRKALPRLIRVATVASFRPVALLISS